MPQNLHPVTKFLAEINVRYPPVGGSTRQTSHSPNQSAAIHDLAGKYPQVGTIQKPCGEKGGTYIIVTGKYGNIYFKMKIKY